MRVYQWCLLLLCGAMGLGACKSTVSFSRHRDIKFTRVVSIPDEAVVYMQNLALMRDNIRVPNVEHLELVLPPRIIVESLQLWAGSKAIRSFNIKSGLYTLLRIRDMKQYLKPGQKLVVEYLTWGVHWSAKYRIEIREKKLHLQLGALLQNNWYNLSSMKLTLVAGWVGGSIAGRYYASLPHPPKKDLLGRSFSPASYDGFALARSKQVQRRRYRQKRKTYSFSKMKIRAFNSELVKRYRIKHVDKTARNRPSNFQRQFARYYKEKRNLNRVSGYSLYKGLQVNMQRNEKSFRWVTSVSVPMTYSYLWPADASENVFIKYTIKNSSSILFPAGAALLYRDGVFLGQDTCLWTPIGGSTSFTTSNDGKITVRKRIKYFPDNSEKTILTIQNFAKKQINMEIFDLNPLWKDKGTLRFSEPPVTAKEKGRHHHWKIRIGPRSIRKIEFTHTLPPPPKPPEAQKKQKA